MKPIKVVIADQVVRTRERIATLVAEHQDYQVHRVCSTVQEARDVIQSDQPDLLILDAGFLDPVKPELTKRLHSSDEYAVIVVSTSGKYAVAAFEVRAADYVIVPFTDDRIRMALDLAQGKIILARLNLHADLLRYVLHGRNGEVLPSGKVPSDPLSPYLKRLAVQSGRTITVINVRDLDYIEGAGVYVNLHVGSNTHLLRESLHRLEERLDPSQFVRIHRSTIANVDRVSQLRPHTHGDYTVTLATGATLKLSRSRYKALETIMGGL